MKKKPICTSVALLLAAMSPTMMAVPLASPQLVNVEISVNRTTVGEVIRHLAQQTGYEFSYDDALLSRELSGVTLNVQNERIENVLKEVFDGTGITYKIVGNRIFLKDNNSDNELIKTKSGGVNQEGKKITGTIVDAQGIPVIGANVLVEGTTNGSITDMDGKFMIEDVAEGAQLRISYIGYKDQIVSVTSKSDYAITLKEDSQALDELVVVGFGTLKNLILTVAVRAVSG